MVQAILGVDRSIAHRIVETVKLQLSDQQQQQQQQQQQLSERATNATTTNTTTPRFQCVYTVARKHRQCKKFGYVGQAIPLCSYHKARTTIPTTVLD